MYLLFFLRVRSPKRGEWFEELEVFTDLDMSAQLMMRELWYVGGKAEVTQMLNKLGHYRLNNPSAWVVATIHKMKKDQRR